MKTKLKIFAFLLLPFCITISCNNRTKQTKNSNEVTQINNEENMEKDSNCLGINDILFEGKQEFLKYIEKKRISFYKDGHNSSIGLIIQYTGESTPFVFPILSYWLNQKGYKAVSPEVFNDKLKNIFKIDMSSKQENIYFGKNYVRYDTNQAYGNEGDIMSDGSFFFSTKYNIFFRPFFNGELVNEIDRTKRYQTCFPERLFHYNNYLFNDDKNSLKWLKKNDMEFLELLDSEFGYSLWKADR